MYGVDNKGYTIPYQKELQAHWSWIMVDAKYITGAKTAAGGYSSAAEPGSIFYCPSGNSDRVNQDLANLDTIPSSRTDERAQMAYPHQNPNNSAEWLHVWYGMNADEGTSMQKGT